MRAMFLKIFAMLLMLDVATFCEKFLIDAEYLIKELGRIRQLALAVPLTRDSYGPTNSVVDAVWNLEERIRYLRGLEESKKNAKQRQSGHTCSSRATSSAGGQGPTKRSCASRAGPAATTRKIPSEAGGPP